MPGGFSFGAAGGGGGVGGAGGSRQQPTYVWDLLPYSRRGVGFAPGSNSHHQQQQQAESSDSAADACGAALNVSASDREQQQQPPPPRQLTESEAALLEQLYQRKVRESGEKYELVATFRLRSGRVHAFHVHRTRVPFQLTERRKKLLREYYSQGCQDVALYVNQAEFEHYMPLSGAFKKLRGASASSNATSGGGDPGSRVTQTRSVNGLKSFLGIS